ncbi:MAG TPA: hypothetical protein PLE55_11780, partial [Clostridiales bacterium]|nr:hypothetical protein [Clostridiales bacterium]
QGNVHLTRLLDLFGLTGRLNENGAASPADETVDYEAVNTILAREKEASLQYLAASSGADMSRTKKFIMNSTTAAAYQVVVLAVGLITPRIMLQTYGSEVNGLVSSIKQFISYFYLVSAGLSGAASYALYKPLADKDYKAINAVVAAAKKFYTRAGWLFVLLTVVLAVAYPFYIKTEALAPLFIGLLVLVLGVSGTLDFFTLSKYNVLLNADQKNFVISLASMVALIINTIMLVFLAYNKVGILELKAIVLFTVFLRSAILMIYCKKNYKYLNYNETPNFTALSRRWDALFQQLLGVIGTSAPAVIITLVSKDLKLVSVYTVFNMVITGLNGVMNIFTNGLIASFGEVIAKGEIKVLQKAYREFEFTYLTLITAVYSITFVVIMPFIRLYTRNITDANYDLPLIGFLFVLNALLSNIKTPQAMLVLSAGMYRETRWRATIQSAIIIVGGVILTPFMGLYGVLIALIASNVYRTIDLLLFTPKYVTHLSVWGSLARLLRVFLASAAV